MEYSKSLRTLSSYVFRNRGMNQCSYVGQNNGHLLKNEILFIDALNLGHLINRRTCELSGDDIDLIAKTCHNW